MTTQESVVNQESNYFDEIDEILSNKYINMVTGEQKILKFMPEKEKGITREEKMFKGEPVEKIRFIVNETHNGSEIEKFFEVGKRSARLIVAKLKAGHRLLRIERVGSGKETLYIPTEVAVAANPK